MKRISALGNTLKQLNDELCELEAKRDKALNDLRKKCNHLRLGEWEAESGRAPLRICLDCGAEEHGWGSGYHVLGIADDTWNIPHKSRRKVVKVCTSFDEYVKIRQSGPEFMVGQDHPNFDEIIRSRSSEFPYRQLSRPVKAKKD